ncbi:MAG: oxidoreductase [Pseudomonadota bacterium]
MTDTTRIWLITGCSTGLGFALAQAVLERGERVVLTARRPEQLAELAAPHGARALVTRLDVTDGGSIDEAVAAAHARFGRIDVLVNAAGYGYLAAIEEGQDDAIRAQFETNVFGLLAVMRRVLPAMRARRSGHIVNFSSIGGLVALPSTGYYHATKFAVEALSESLWHETAPLGVKVTLVEPGPFRTEFAGRSLVTSPIVIADYADTAGKRAAQSRAHSGKQAGDPVRAAAAIIEAVEADQPPLRLVLGQTALKMAYAKLDTLRDNFDAWRDVSVNVDFPPL